MSFSLLVYFFRSLFFSISKVSWKVWCLFLLLPSQLFGWKSRLRSRNKHGLNHFANFHFPHTLPPPGPLHCHRRAGTTTAVLGPRPTQPPWGASGTAVRRAVVSFTSASMWATISGHRPPLALPPQAPHQHSAPLRPLRRRRRPSGPATTAVDLLPPWVALPSEPPFPPTLPCASPHRPSSPAATTAVNWHVN
jgi:hypothetical protein